MFVILGCNRMWNAQSSRTAVVCMAIVSIVFAALFTAGCKKKVVENSVGPAPKKLESVITNRMNDAAYLGSLHSNRVAQSVQANERQRLAVQIQACEERVKAALPAGSDEAAIKAAWARDPEWQKLSAQRAEVDGRIQATLNDARETIRRRMESEAQAVKAVAEGKALPIDQAKVPK